jgi:hypothetical protein
MYAFGIQNIYLGSYLQGGKIKITESIMVFGGY